MLVKFAARTRGDNSLTIDQIDYQNAASVKVLQVGKPTNVLKQLHMTADQYNWVQSIYFVSARHQLTIPHIRIADTNK